MRLLRFVSPTSHETVILPQVTVYHLTNELQCKVPSMPISICYYSGNYRNFRPKENGLLPVVSNNSFWPYVDPSCAKCATPTCLEINVFNNSDAMYTSSSYDLLTNWKDYLVDKRAFMLGFLRSP